MKKTCFVIIGYGIKTDYKSGRDIDLDKTYRTIIEPVFTDLGFLCFRASDIKHSGSIDLHMYESILKADFVIADISTLNPNVLYELGIRHAVRRNTTFIIAEKELENPFDLGHIVIDTYEHLGKAIDYEEVNRFRKLLKEKVKALLEEPKVDSPLYTVIPNLNHPHFTKEEVEEIEDGIEEESSLSDIVTKAETARKAMDFPAAIELYRLAVEISQGDDFVVQRLALSTYKSKLPDEKTALIESELILQPLKPETTTDPETLGLSGAINKRLYEVTDNKQYLERSLGYYERGYYIKQDYYNGINAAFLYTVMALAEENSIEAGANYGQGMRLRRQVLDRCDQIVADKGFEEREDKAWIYATMAEAHIGLGQDDASAEYEQKFKEIADEFSVESYQTQRSKLVNLIDAFNKKYGGK